MSLLELSQSLNESTVFSVGVTILYKTCIKSGQPALGGHLWNPRWWPLITGSTVSSLSLLSRKCKASYTPSVRIVNSFKNLKAVYVVRQPLCHLRSSIQNVFTRVPIGDDLIIPKKKPTKVNRHYVSNQFKCGFCTSSYVSNTCQHFHSDTHIDEHNIQVPKDNANYKRGFG